MELRVKEVCKEKGVTLAEVASMIGIAQASLSKMLGGNPTLGTLSKIADALGVEITELFEPNSFGEVNGYVKVNGVLYEVNSFGDLKKLLELEK